MLQIRKTSKSISISGEGNSISLVVKPGNTFEFHQSLQGRDSKAAAKVQNELKNIFLNKLDKKSNYEARVSKVANMLQGFGEVNTFAALKNKLANAVAA